MRSFLRPANEVASAVPAGTGSTNAAAPSPPGSPQPGPEREAVETQLFEAMDRAALRLVSHLDAMDEQGKSPLSTADTMKLFEMGERWLKNRAKNRPEIPDGDGILLLKRLVEDPVEIVKRLQHDEKFINELTRRGWLKPLPKPVGRPSRDYQTQKTAYEAHRAQLEPGAEPPPEPQQDASGWANFGKEV